MVEVELGRRTLDDYTHLVGRGLIEEIRELARGIQGFRVLHVSASAEHDPVAELLYTLVPLMRNVGLNAHWQVMAGRQEFPQVTKLMEGSLQGSTAVISDEQWKVFDSDNALNARALGAGWDVVAVHNLGPLGLRHTAGHAARRWIWNCYLDISTPSANTLAVLLPHMKGYDRTVWRSGHQAPSSLDQDKISVIAPAIDPLSPKNMALGRENAAFVCEQFGVDVKRPLISQVSGFDAWSDPIGVIDMFRLVRQEVPEAQLALVGWLGINDADGWELFHKTFSHADGDPDIKILNNLNIIGEIEVNAFQSGSQVVVQQTTRDGFRRSVAEALWKGRPLVPSNVGGINSQIDDGASGFLADSPHQGAARCIEVLRNVDLARRLGNAARERVRRDFLAPRLLRDWLTLVDRGLRDQEHVIASPFAALEPVMAPALSALEDPRLRHGPKMEFDSVRKELQHNTRESRKQATTEACNAVESVMKILCEEKKVELHSPPTAQRLYDALLAGNVFQREHEGLILGPSRFGNKRGRHGAGRIAHAVTEAEVVLVVSGAAMAIAYLAKQLP